MAYDEELAARVRDVLVGEPGLTERKMFGGLAFLIDGHMTVAASGQEDGLLLRVDPALQEELLAEPHTDPFVMQDRTMRGWLRVKPAGFTTEPELERWVGLGVGFVRTLPPK
jgi:TfoX/Sxy family transcriptional regulator of competence genes